MTDIVKIAGFELRIGRDAIKEVLEKQAILGTLAIGGAALGGIAAGASKLKKFVQKIPAMRAAATAAGHAADASYHAAEAAKSRQAAGAAYSSIADVMKKFHPAQPAASQVAKEVVHPVSANRPGMVQAVTNYMKKNPGAADLAAAGAGVGALSKMDQDPSEAAKGAVIGGAGGALIGRVLR